MSNLQGGSSTDFPTSDLAEPLKTPLTEPIPHATPLFILFFASIFELISASVMCSDIASLYGSCFGVVGYAVAVGAVSSALCIFMFICLANKSTSIHALHVAPMPTSCFLLLWWLVGWFTLTFNAPFTYVGNGYFASWLGVAAAAALCHAHTPQLASLYEKAVAWARGEPRQGIVAALAATSTVVWIEGAVALGGTEQACITAGGAAGQLVACGNGSVEAWAIAVGVVSTVVCLLAIFLKPQLAKFERCGVLAPPASSSHRQSAPRPTPRAPAADAALRVAPWQGTARGARRVVAAGRRDLVHPRLLLGHGQRVRRAVGLGDARRLPRLGRALRRAEHAGRAAGGGGRLIVTVACSVLCGVWARARERCSVKCSRSCWHEH